MTWVFTFDCRFFEASVKEIIDEEHPLLTFGLWTVQDYYLYYDEGYYYDESPYGMCIGWNQHSFLNREDNIDGPLRFARVVSIILSLLSWVLLVVLLFASCMIFSPRAMQSLAWSFGLVGVCCLLCLVSTTLNLYHSLHQQHTCDTKGRFFLKNLMLRIVSFSLSSLTCVFFAFSLLFNPCCFLL